MSQVLERPAVPDPEALDDLDRDVEVSATAALEKLWRFFIAMRTGLFLMLALGVLSFAGTMLAQAPAGMKNDPQAYAQWVQSLRPRYGGWTTVFDKLGLLSVFSSWLFRGTVVLLATSLIACSINRTPHLWDRAKRPPRRRGESFFNRAALRATLVTPKAPGAALEDVRAALKGKHFRVVTDEHRGDLTVYADQNRWSPFGSIMTHLAFVLILVGFVLSSTTGFKDSNVTVPVGSTVAVGHGTHLSVEATNFSDSYYPDGEPKRYESDLILFKNGRRVASKSIEVNHPLRYGGVSFYQSFFGIAAAVRATDKTGKVLYDDASPLQWQSQDGKHSIGQFTLPAQGLTVYVVSAASGQVDPNIPAGTVQLEIYNNSSQDTPIATQVVTQGKSQTVAGVTYTFERIKQFTGLIVRRDPGTTFVWAGSIFLVLGIFWVMSFPHRRMWVRVRASGSGSDIRAAATLGDSAHRDSAFQTSFTRLVNDIQLAVNPTSAHESEA